MMPDKQSIIFLDYFIDLKHAVFLINTIRKRLKTKPIIVSSNYDIDLLATHTGLKVIYFDTLLSNNDYKFMYDYVFNLTREWYLGLKPTENITEYKGISFGSIAEEMAHCSFSFLVKNLEISLKIITNMNPGRLIFIGERDTFIGLYTFVTKNFNIRTMYIQNNEEKHSILKRLKNFRLCLLDVFLQICDSLMRRVMLLTKNDKPIFIDGRIYLESHELVKDFFVCPYLLEKGLRIRLKLFKNNSFKFVPFLLKDFFALPSLPVGRFYRYWKSLDQNEDFKKKFNYKGLCIWPIVKRRIREFFVQDFKRINKNITFLTKLYTRLRPNLVILREAVKELQRTLVFTAKYFKIPTLVIQHGVLAQKNVYTYLCTDKIALWGPAGIEEYRKFGNDVNKCIVTGNPAHDRLYLQENYNIIKKTDDVFLKMGIDLTKETVLYLPNFLKKYNYLPNVYYTWDSEHPLLNSIFNIADYFPNKQWIIKVHPFDPIDIKLLACAKKERYPNIFIVKNEPIKPLIEISSLVIVSYFSSAILDVVILDKPIISVKVDHDDEVSPLVSQNVAVGIDSPNKLLQAVRHIFEDEKIREELASNRKKFIYDYAYKIDGKSTVRVNELIREICENGSIADKSFM